MEKGDVHRVDLMRSIAKESRIAFLVVYLGLKSLTNTSKGFTVNKMRIQPNLIVKKHFLYLTYHYELV